MMYSTASGDMHTTGFLSGCRVSHVLLDLWKTLARGPYPEPIHDLQVLLGYKSTENVGGGATPLDAEFLHVCLTTCTERFRNALRNHGEIIEEDPSEWLALVTKKLGIEQPSAAMVDSFSQLIENEKNGLCLFLDSRPALRRLKSLGYSTVLVSNVYPFPMRHLFSEGEGGFGPGEFDHVILSCEVGYAKPSAEIYYEAARRSGADLSNCVMVGDNPLLDVEGALRVGAKAVHIDRYRDCRRFIRGVPVIAKMQSLFGEVPAA